MHPFMIDVIMSFGWERLQGTHGFEHRTWNDIYNCFFKIFQTKTASTASTEDVCKPLGLGDSPKATERLGSGLRGTSHDGHGDHAPPSGQGIS